MVGPSLPATASTVGRSVGVTRGGAALTSPRLILSSRRTGPCGVAKPSAAATWSRGLSARRSGADSAARGTVLRVNAPCSVSPFATTRRCTGAIRASPRSGLDAMTVPRYRLCQMSETSFATSARRMRRFASMMSPTWPQAASMYSSWFFWTTAVPKPAGTRKRGSRLSSCTQFWFCGTSLPSGANRSRSVSACQRP